LEPKQNQAENVEKRSIAAETQNRDPPERRLKSDKDPTFILQGAVKTHRFKNCDMHFSHGERDRLSYLEDLKMHLKLFGCLTGDVPKMIKLNGLVKWQGGQFFTFLVNKDNINPGRDYKNFLREIKLL
jgi:hypothetical protein